jgi:hypothetical protein
MPSVIAQEASEVAGARLDRTLRRTMRSPEQITAHETMMTESILSLAIRILLSPLT